jgi:hypothetical protein
LLHGTFDPGEYRHQLYVRTQAVIDEKGWEARDRGLDDIQLKAYSETPFHEQG